MLPFTLKYAPSSLLEIIGQEKAVASIRAFFASSKRKKGLFLYGPPGSGKTSTAYACARERNCEILEVNASDFRNEEQLQKTIGHASEQRSLFGGSKIILVDEVEGIAGREDRGGVATLKNIIKTSPYPLILTANDVWDKKFAPLRTSCELVEFKELNTSHVLTLLRKVCQLEKITYDEKAIVTLAGRSGGDVRGALIDLQTLLYNNKFTFDQLELLSPRRRTESIFDAMMKIFKTTEASVARGALENIDEDIDEIFLWIEENVPKEYTKPKDLYRAMEKLARADVFRGRIRRRQHWHFLAVISILLSAGIALSKEQKYTAFVRYGPTQRILSMWRAKQKYALRTAIAEKIAKRTHCSVKVARDTTLPYVRAIGKKENGIFDFFDLNEEEVEWMKGQ